MAYIDFNAISVRFGPLFAMSTLWFYIGFKAGVICKKNDFRKWRNIKWFFTEKKSPLSVFLLHKFEH